MINGVNFRLYKGTFYLRSFNNIKTKGTPAQKKTAWILSKILDIDV